MSSSSLTVSIPILAEIMHKSEDSVRKIYRSIVTNDCVPLDQIPPEHQQIYAHEYLYRDRLVDFCFLESIRDYDLSSPLCHPDVQQLFQEMQMIRTTRYIAEAYAATGSVTERLRDLAEAYGISYSTLARRRNTYMNSTPLSRVLNSNRSAEDTKDRYRTCCFYCRDYIIYRHESAEKPSNAKILRDLKKAEPFPCAKCPYHPDTKAGRHKKGDFIPTAICKRNREYMQIPNCNDTVDLATLTDNSKLRFFAFDTPFNRSISIVQGHQYIGEAHIVEKLNIVEAQRYKVVLHLMEQKRQRRFFSQRLAELHNIILQTDILQHIDAVPAIDDVRYAPAIDTNRDQEESIDDQRVPEELKRQAEHAAQSLLDPDAGAVTPGKTSQRFREIGKQLASASKSPSNSNERK